MDLRNVPLNDLVLDPNLNLRDRLDDFTVERYADSWDRLPPITVYEIDGKWLVADGFHRHAAAVMLGKRTDPRRDSRRQFTDALDFVSSVNLFHGLPLTRSERAGPLRSSSSSIMTGPTAGWPKSWPSAASSWRRSAVSSSKATRFPTTRDESAPTASSTPRPVFPESSPNGPGQAGRGRGR